MKPTKITYIKNGIKDCLFLGSATTEEQKEKRIAKMKEQGFEIISCENVETIA